MPRHRLPRLVALLALVLAGVLAQPPRARAADTWSLAASPAGDYGGHTATVLPDGRVLVVGRTAERYDPAADAWGPAPPPPTPRYGQTATTLPDGRVLFVGGVTTDRAGALAAAELYDPATDTWAVAAPLAEAREEHTATLLPDGRVLVVGGRRGGPSLTTAELYDPAADRWRPAAPLGTPRAAHTATLLPDGRVLVAGGLSSIGGRVTNDLATTEVYDPATDTWRAAARMLHTHFEHTATPLPDRTILVVGGLADGATAAERYDPAADRWAAAGTLAVARERHAATLLADGQVLVTGGYPQMTTAERYDPAANRWRPAGTMQADHASHTATRLRDGAVLVVGGSTARVDPATGRRVETTVERYSDGAPAACFDETGFCIQGRFLAAWVALGGLALNGYPLSGEFAETLEDGKRYTVQYFERVRMEQHPENAPPYDVLLGQFGRRVLRTQSAISPFQIAPTTPRPGAAYFPETGHNLAGGFLAYWQANGGLAQFGYPLTEEVAQQLEDGNIYTVQYFERARFEHHPENAAPYDILLGQFGRRILAENDLLAGVPGFQQLYVTSERVQTVLGMPAGPAVATPGATQAFERGRMVWRGDTRRITVFCGEEQAGPIVWEYNETWEEGQDPGGGPAPVPGRYLPQRGFGKLWREEQAVRDCLGYALTPGETSYPLHMQPFVHGYFGVGNQMLSVVTPEGRFIYVVFDTYLGGSSCISRPDLCVPDYERYPDPTT